MGSINIPVAQLNSSKTIPLLGFGTAVSGASHETIRDSVIQAIELGYRHFDSASVYNNELPLGDAIAEALRRGLIKSRDELFITSKLWTSDAHPDHVLPALKKSLRNLKLEYLDLYLVHWPVSSKPGELYFPVRKEEVLPMDIKSVWEAMEKCQELGLTRSIGVSNFSCKKLEFLLATSKIPPAVNQVEMHPMWQQKKLREFCKEKGIHVSAYSPLGAVGTSWGTNLVMDNEVLKEIANANGKSVAQVCLRWGYEQGISVIVKSFNEERMANNLDIFHWKLSPEDLQKISQLPHHKTNSGAYFISDEGPIKSLEEFWDGEI